MVVGLRLGEQQLKFLVQKKMGQRQNTVGVYNLVWWYKVVVHQHFTTELKIEYVFYPLCSNPLCNRGFGVG